MDEVDAGKVFLSLRNRHSGSEWATFSELRTRPGYDDVGYIDFYAVGLWAKNKGFYAYEVKVSRSDFKADIASFGVKQAAAIRNSNQFFYACPHGMIQPEEVPDVAGLIWVDAAGAKVKKVAPIRELSGSCLDVGFTMALLRAAAGEPLKRTISPKYLGRDLSEADLLRLAKETAEKKDAQQIQSLARVEAAKTRQRARQILLKFCHGIGMHGEVDYGTVDQVADRMVHEYEAKSSAISTGRAILYNVRNVKRLVEELERELDNTRQEETHAPQANSP